MRRVLSIATAVLSDAARRKIPWVVVLFAAVMAAMIPMLPSYGVGVAEAVYREVALALTFVATLVVALALAANRVPAELERRTVYSVLARPVRRWEYVVGTWLGVVMTLAVASVLFGVVILGVGFATYRELMFQLFQGVAAIWMEASVIAGAAITASVLAGPVIAVLVSLTLLFIGHVRSVLLTPDAGPAYYLYPSLEIFDVFSPVAHGTGLTLGYMAAMIAAFAGWSAILMVLATLAFRRRDL